MRAYVALLRAVNVGGAGKLPMSDLAALCEKAGFPGARTYIASGNVLLRSALPEAEVKSALEAAPAEHAGKPVGVMIRTGEQMRAIVAANPFAARPGSRVLTLFLDAAPPADALEQARHRADEEMALGEREIFVFYPDGVGRSKLVIPAARAGTGRNMNTVTKLAAMAAES